jgi:NIPSNAP
MLHELRIYEAIPGQMPALHKRFREITGAFFEKHDIKIVAYWDAVIGTTNVLYYLVEWQSLAEREQKWGAFMADPEWSAARAKTEANGPLVAKVTNMILRPTDYSPLK